MVRSALLLTAFPAALFAVTFGVMAQTAAISFCRETGKIGLGLGETEGSAVADSIRRCIGSGGRPGCCQVVAMTQEGCVSIALPKRAPTKFGVGQGDTEEDADDEAIADCGRDCTAVATQCVP
jgi:hypothetical protein